MNSAARIARRYVYGDGLINLNSIPIVIADGGVVSAGDLERHLGLHDIEAHDVVLYRLDDDPETTLRWAGRGAGNATVRGQLVFRLNYDRKHVVVSGEIALAARYVASQRESEEAPATEPTLPLKQRLLLISSISRRAIAALRANPTDISAVLSHLSDLVEISEQPGWAVEP